MGRKRERRGLRSPGFFFRRHRVLRLVPEGRIPGVCSQGHGGLGVATRRASRLAGGVRRRPATRPAVYVTEAGSWEGRHWLHGRRIELGWAFLQPERRGDPRQLVVLLVVRLATPATRSKRFVFGSFGRAPGLD